MVATIIVAGVKVRTESQLFLYHRGLPLLAPFRETDGQKHIQRGETDGQKSMIKGIRWNDRPVG